MFPDHFTFSIDNYVNKFVDWLIINHGEFFVNSSNFIVKLFIPFENLLRISPWWLIISVIGVLSFFSTRSFKFSIVMMSLLFLMGILGLWDESMQTLSLVLISTFLVICLGLPLGILLSKSGKIRFFILPVLDAMQTLPSFVYLIPVLMLFGLGKVPALIATIIYALPPVVKLTDLGIRQVDKRIIDATDSFGATAFQKLLKVELPLALPSIMLGINQATMMALSMVVIASMIGNRGLGQEVLLGINTLDVGRGSAAGIAIVAMAIVIDRLTQSFSIKLQKNKGINQN
ncbi:MAG: proline/glycine betaine ABC transporter permease [Pseudomonadota bacterium]|nr:proline/glycine betaine ABC transporter permease [Pseudomonadota bacterium]